MEFHVYLCAISPIRNIQKTTPHYTHTHTLMHMHIPQTFTSYLTSSSKCPIHIWHYNVWYCINPPFTHYITHKLAVLMPTSKSKFQVFFKVKYPFFKKCYLFQRKREHKHEPGRGREADSPLSRDPDVGLNPRTLRSWPEPKVAG